MAGGETVIAEEDYACRDNILQRSPPHRNAGPDLVDGSYLSEEFTFEGLKYRVGS